MQKSGVAQLKLHGGKAPPWLFKRMVKLGGSIMTILVEEYDTDGVLSRISNPFFFQSLSNALGFDWNSSGTTTVLCGVLQTVFDKENFGLSVVGGKGNRARGTQSGLVKVADEFSLNQSKLDSLKYASRITAKVDNVAIQDEYPLYHHSIFVSEEGKWAVVQQGMNPEYRTARRYHWLSSHVKDFVEEPHDGIVGEMVHDTVLDLTSRKSKDCRGTVTDIVKDNPEHIKREFTSIKPGQKTLMEWGHKPKELRYVVPKRMDWAAVEKAYELQPENFEGLLAIRGVGPATVRGLALISELIYGDPPSWKDPVKYSFAFGGKDGVPFPVLRKDYDKTIEILESAIEQSKLGDQEKLSAIKRLRKDGD